jgi:ankyrin repeat protein
VGGETPLILAAENNAIDCVAALLKAGADTNKQRMNGDTALIAACAHDYHATAGERGIATYY